MKRGMIVKKLIAILCIVACLISISAFAIETDKLICQADFYTGTLYYCDAERGMAVLRNVQPIGENTEARRWVSNEATYNELPVCGNVNLSNGDNVPLEDCNLYADSNVRVLIIRDAADRLQIVIYEIT